MLTQQLILAITGNIPGVPFKHFVLRLPDNATVEDILERYKKLLHATQKALTEANAGTDYNVVLVKDWLALIPRASKGRDGVFAGATTMIGLVWLRNQEERDKVTKFGYEEFLCHLGLPLSKGI